jgi:hypothetical protein
LVDLKAEVSIRTFERQKVKIFHKSNSIYAIKIEGDVDNEYTWKYLAVYKGDDDKYYESRVSYQWLVDNFEESYLEALKEQKVMGAYMIYNDSELQYVRKFPIEDYIKDKTNRFNQALWSYQIKDKSVKIWSLRATCTFDKKTFDKGHTNSDDNPLDVAIITTFSVCFQKTNRKKISSGQKNIYNLAKYQDMTDIFSLDKLYSFRGDILRWWEDDYKILTRNKTSCIYYKADKDRYYDYNDSEQFFELISDDGKKGTNLRCIKSPLGKLKEKQVYYWKFTENDVYDWNQTKIQISMMKWDIAQNQFIGLESDSTPGEKKSYNTTTAMDGY